MIIATVYLVLRRFMRLISVARHVGVMDALWEGVRRIARFAAIVTILFMILWGLNYRRLNIEFSLHTNGNVPVTQEFLQSGISDANALATRLRLGTNSGEILSFEQIAQELRDPMDEALTSLNREPLRTPSRPKYSLVMTPFFTWTGVDG